MYDLAHIEGNADRHDGLSFADANGRPLATHPTPRLPDAPPPQPEVRYQHPSGERIRPSWVGLGWVHPNALVRRREQLQKHYERTRQRRQE